ncbi:MAG: FKBP-type peptidyl-prolyl cis-trans isomerase [Waddliaceae bacterium]
MLGYGTKNSLAFERIRTLTEPLYTINSKNPLYKINRYGADQEETINILAELDIKQGLHYATLREELDDLTKSMRTSVSEIQVAKPTIFFNTIENDFESIQLERDYLAVQAKVQAVLKAGDLFSQVSKKFQISINEISDKPSLIARANLPTLIAENLCKLFHFKDPESKTLFINGLILSQKEEGADYYLHANHLKILDDNSHFDSLNPGLLKSYLSKGSAEEIVKDKLYYRVVKRGDGKALSKKCFYGAFHFLIQDAWGESIAGSFSFEPEVWLDFSKVIPGFAHGVLGMQLGEKRELFIHPDLAYGFNSDFGQRAFITIFVELIGYREKKDFKEFSEPFPVDYLYLKRALKNFSIEDFEDMKNKSVVFKGIRAWDFYKQLQIDLDDVIDKINYFHQNSCLEGSFDMNTVHYKMYYGSSL